MKEKPPSKNTFNCFIAGVKACPDNNFHELPLLILAFFCTRSKGESIQEVTSTNQIMGESIQEWT